MVSIFRIALALLLAPGLASARAEFRDGFIVAAGSRHTCAANGDGVYCWGSNARPDLPSIGIESTMAVGVPASLGQITAVVSGALHVCVLNSAGDVYCLGDNLFGQLGDGTLTSRSSLVRVSLPESAYLIFAGIVHTCAALQSGRLMCWGRNNDGQLGDGSQVDRPSPTEVVGIANVVSAGAGDEHSCAVTSEGAAYCWGSDAYGQLGNADDRGLELTPTAVYALGSGVASIDADYRTSCAVMADSTPYCWGSIVAPDGSFYNRDRRQTITNFASGANRISVGGGFVCATTTTDDVHCWGGNYEGQVGSGTGSFVQAGAALVALGSGVVALSAGGTHACASLADGLTKCWGSNSHGQLGTGTYDNSRTPVAVITAEVFTDGFERPD